MQQPNQLTKKLKQITSSQALLVPPILEIIFV
jgi:hypothetical protein